MRPAIAVALLLSALPAGAEPPQAAGGYRVCTPDASEQGRGVVAEACGTLAVPDFSGVAFQSAEELESARVLRDRFLGEVEAYGRCISVLIDASSRPGIPAAVRSPDQAACAHSWAEDQATEAVRGFGRACVDYANRSVMDYRLLPYEGPCYPVVEAPAPAG
ncbi:MAG TPA: hypothetical protein P5341_09970 [Hyphomonas sp.]|nr:hypothetical protein [Hyphomonas sp.]